MYLTQKLVDAGLVKRGEFTLKSGKKSNTYFDFKGLTNYPKLVLEISYELSKFINDEDECIAGVPIGGIPYAMNIGQIKNLPVVLVRTDVKQYGLRKLIEGNPKSITLIEDVITSGESVINMIRLIEGMGTPVKKVICILNRQDCGGTVRLRDMGHRIHTLFEMNDFIESPISPRFIKKHNPIVEKLINIINEKKTNIIVSLDMGSSIEILKMIELIGNYVCGIKLHHDIIKDKTKEFSDKLLQLKDTMNILIIEDRKFADLPYISMMQVKQLESYVDIVTVHGISGESLISELNQLNVGLLLVHQLSFKDNLIDTVYSCRVRDFGKKYQNVIGFVSQYSVCPDYLTFTPGISMDKKNDGKGQTYRDIDKCNSDIFIIGRDLTEATNILGEAKRFKEIGFKKWQQNFSNPVHSKL